MRKAARLAGLLALLAQIPLAAIEVRITEPEFGVPVFGRVVVAADVESEREITSVEIFLDGSLAERYVPPQERERDTAGPPYWLRLPLGERPGNISSAWRDGAGHRRELSALEGLVRASGGRAVPLASLAGTAEAFAEILAELRGQYVLGYYPEPRRNDGRWREVRVRAGSGVKVRARDGYTDY